MEDFNFDHQPALNRDMIAPLAIGLAIKAAQTGHRITFAPAVDWVARLKAAHNAGRLPAELAKLRRIGLLVIDEVG